MNVAEILSAAETPWGEQRFFPAWQHPATTRLREQRDRLLTFMAPSELLDDALAYIERELARFEWGEFRAKQQYVDYMAERLERESQLGTLGD